MHAEDLVDVSAVVNPWQALVVVVLIVVVLGGPQLAAWRNSRLAKEHAKRGADEITHQSQPNSGLSLKDSLNRLEVGVGEIKVDVTEIKATQSDQGARLAALERVQMRRRWLWR